MFKSKLLLDAWNHAGDLLRRTIAHLLLHLSNSCHDNYNPEVSQPLVNIADDATLNWPCFIYERMSTFKDVVSAAVCPVRLGADLL